MNTIILRGYLSADAQIRYIGAKQTPCVNFSVAYNKRFKNERGNIEEKAMFFEVIIYGNYAQKILTSLKKGTLVFLQGSLNQDSWEKEGQKHSKITIIASKLHIIQKNTPLTQPNQQPPNQQTQHISAQEVTNIINQPNP
ncbi:single-stranded DNA-binding protein [Helicobacter sp. 10-6591]|uniref:single-stranded DNA-binding protein n=1 Tax=Helicobacter sp. 10-6591 TaxID=2004998 RepID=UPI000DCB6BB2|nr:single-stranded DNA-binding protein [Helicobacter sp. 10-6591]RAX55484.1 hypothetical protein CCY97_04250 [Helicobacter sp. 10-6591]